jgi:putative nucleotidyltransferase with HDIG domain
LIKLAGQVLQKSARSGEIIGRHGGDEFMIILPNTSEENVQILMERITNNAKRIHLDTGTAFSISLGSSTKEDNSVTINDTFKEAEDNMYKDKIHRGPSVRRHAIDTMLQTLFEKDPTTETHSRNVASYAKSLGETLGLSSQQISRIETAALLHDIGKILIDDTILKSTSILSKEDYEGIKEHSIIGYRILNSVDDLQDIANIVLHHHERIDGSGYPQGVTGDSIPLESKIISICDAYDAMVGERGYRTPLSKDQVIKEFESNKGLQFDSKIVDQFIKCIKEKMS